MTGRVHTLDEGVQSVTPVGVLRLAREILGRRHDLEPDGRRHDVLGIGTPQRTAAAAQLLGDALVERVHHEYRLALQRARPSEHTWQQIRLLLASEQLLAHVIRSEEPWVEAAVSDHARGEVARLREQHVRLLVVLRARARARVIGLA